MRYWIRVATWFPDEDTFGTYFLSIEPLPNCLDKFENKTSNDVMATATPITLPFNRLVN
jgi:hypothetical protein